MGKMGWMHGLDADRLADELRLGALQRRYRTILLVHLGQFAFGLVILVLLCLVLWNFLHGVASGPSWVDILFFGIGPVLCALFIWLAWHGFRERQVLLRHEHGLIELTRSSMRAIRWDDITEVWHSPEHWIVSSGTAVLRLPSLALLDATGERLEVGPYVSKRTELIQVVREAVVPRLQARFEGIIAGGGQVHFGPLALSAQGLEMEDGRRRLAWADVKDVRRSGDGIEVRARGALLPWFEGVVPNSDILIEIARER